MAGDALPSDIHSFLAGTLGSVERLEVLLLLKSKPEAAWSVKSVYQIILSSESSIERGLEDFVKLGLARKSGMIPATYEYVVDGARAELVEELAQLFKLKPVRVIEAIYKKRLDPAQGFADAFRFNPKG